MDLNLRREDIEVGITYPICGMITEIVESTIHTMTVVVDHYFRLTLTLRDDDSKELIKRRAFEPAIFISTFKSKYEADCETVVFGKEQRAVHN